MRKPSIFVGISVIFGLLMTSQAYAVEVNKKVPISLLIPVPCTGENVFFTGTDHVVFNDKINKNGRLEFIYHENLMGVSGVGETSGEKYRITSISKENSGKDTTDGYPVDFTFVQNLHILRLGWGNVYTVHMLCHYTINANGELTVDIDNLTIEGDCK